MKTQLSTGNPFGHDRYGYLWEVLRSQVAPGHHLDFGARDGSVLQRLAATGRIAEGVGIEASRAHVSRYSPDLPANVRLLHLPPGQPLPFADATFDSASLLDVYEHVSDQASLLDEMWRTLKPGGTLVVTVPKAHLFSVLDPGNFKFRWPRLHRLAFVARHSRSAYEARYVGASDGLYGDIEADKMWHEHFTPEGLTLALETHGFVEVQTDGAGFWARPLSLLALVAGVSSNRVLANLHERDFVRHSSTHLFSAAIRGPAGRLSGPRT